MYDIKIEGINRLYACAGDFNVTYDGVLRDPPQSFINTLIKSYTNENMDKEKFKENILANHLIKIPDVYHVNMQF